MICIKDWNDFQSFFIEKESKKVYEESNITIYGNYQIW